MRTIIFFYNNVILTAELGLYARI